jgi:hypothetical protein
LKSAGVEPEKLEISQHNRVEGGEWGRRAPVVEVPDDGFLLAGSLVV